MGNGEKKNDVEMWICPNIKKEGTKMKSIKQSHFFTDLPPESFKKIYYIENHGREYNLPILERQ